MNLALRIILWLAFISACLLPASALTPTVPENRIWEIFSIGYDAPIAEATDLANRTETSTSNYDTSPIHRADGEHRSALGTCALFGPNAEFKAAEGGGGITTLFHGTDLESAQNIVTNGIDQQAAREMGGGDVFWTTHEQDLADLFAQANPKGGAPSTVQFDLSSSSLNSILQSGAAKFDPVVNGYQINDWDAFNAAVLRSSIK